MLKKTLLIAILCFSLMPLMNTEANAYPSTLAGWWNWVFGGSLNITTEWIGIANTDLKPTGVWITLRIRSFYIDEVYNPGGEQGGIGQPFIEIPVPAIEVFNEALITDVPLKGRGTYGLPMTFSDAALTQAILAGADDDLLSRLPKLPNPNWLWHVVLLDFDILIQGFTDINDRCEGAWNENNCTITEKLNQDGDVIASLMAEEVVFAVGYCIVQGWTQGSEDISNVNFNAPYNCAENFHWEYKNKSPLCEDEYGGCDYDNWFLYNN